MHYRAFGVAAVFALGAQAESTSTAWSPYPAQTTTITEYPTCPSPVTLKETQYVSLTASSTIFETVIYTNTVTTTQPTTEITTLIQPTTETTIQPTTEISLVTEIQLLTETETTPTTIIEVTPTTLTETTPTTVTVTVTTPTTQSVTLTATQELELYTSTTTFTSLRLCPTRLVNPTFTAILPLPLDWTWGCPPGWICKPVQENCDFEVGVPDRNFYCAPNDCVPAPALPLPLPNWGDTIYSNSTPLNTPGLGVNALTNYFNVAPTDFGLGYEIFVVTKVIIVTSTFVVAPGATGLPPPPPPPADNYTGFKARQAQTNIPAPCYTWCNNPMLEIQALGKTSELCQPDSAFLISLSQCRACIDYRVLKNPSDINTFLRIAPQFQQFLDYCAGFVTTTVNGEPTAFATSGGAVQPQPTVVPSTVTEEVTGTSTSGLAPTPGTTLSDAEMEALTIIIARSGTTTTLSGDDLENATLILAAVGASQTEIVTTGSSTYTTEVPFTESSLGDETSGISASQSIAATPTSGAAPTIESGNVADKHARPGMLGMVLPFALALL